MKLSKILRNAATHTGTAREAAASGNVKVLLNLLGPGIRGFLFQKAKGHRVTEVPVAGSASFNWTYERDHPKLARLYSAAKRDQWNAETDLDWTIDVDPLDPERELMFDEILPLREIPEYRALPADRQREHRHGIVSWMLSQFLHGEQGALFAACEVTQGLSWMDGKLYGSTQVVDEGRHVEVFARYLLEKLEKPYEINDNLYVVIDSLITDARWDLKFLGMQIMIEGLALGAFQTMRQSTNEPLLKELLKRVITDEARHVHYGVVALEQYYTCDIPEARRREREDWAFEVSLLMRNRFLAHEFYDEYYGHILSRKQWDELVLGSDFLRTFRHTMFRRIVPNLKRIGLLTDRIRPHYEKLGLLEYEKEKAAPELTAADLLN